MRGAERFIHNDTSPFLFVIPGLIRNPVPSWIPAFAGMTECEVINVAVYRRNFNKDPRSKLRGIQRKPESPNPPNPLFQRGDLSGHPVASYGE